MLIWWYELLKVCNVRPHSSTDFGLCDILIYDFMEQRLKDLYIEDYKGFECQREA